MPINIPFTNYPAGVAGTGARIGGGIADALQQGIGSYLQMRQQSLENTMKQQQMANEAEYRKAMLAQQGQQLDLERQRFGETQKENEGKGLEWMLGNYGGQPAPSDAVTAITTRHPELAAGLKPEQLPLAPPQVQPNLRGGDMLEGGAPTDTGPAPAQSPMYFTPTGTGRSIIQPTEDSKMRAALLAQSGQNMRANATNQVRMNIATMEGSENRRRDDIRLAIANASQALQRFGIDTRHGDTQAAIERGLYQFGMDLPYQDWKAKIDAMHANPLSMLQFLGGTNPLGTPPQQAPTTPPQPPAVGGSGYGIIGSVPLRPGGGQ